MSRETDKNSALRATDPEIDELIRLETKRQDEFIRLIPSENYASTAVMEATGSILNNKYSEGYPGRRYYEGQDYIDRVETLAIERAKALFGMEHANVQPYSGSPANQAVYLALAKPGDPVMGLGLPFGGHLTHGWGVNFSGIVYHASQYDVDPETHRVDLNRVEALARATKPKLIFCGGTAYPRVWDYAGFAQIAKSVGATLVADIAHIAGLVVAGAHPHPYPHARIVTTTTHKTLRGPRAGMILSKQEFAAAIDKVVFPGMQGGPLVHIIAAKAVSFLEAMQPEFKDYARQIVANATVLAETLAAEGFRIISGGTDTHLMLVDVFSKGILGSEAEKALGEAAITVNKNAIPFDVNPPLKPSGIRIGTPALTTRGMKEAEMRQVGRWISEALHHRTDGAVLGKIRKQVLALAEAFPLYPERRAKAQVELRA